MFYKSLCVPWDSAKATRLILFKLFKTTCTLSQIAQQAVFKNVLNQPLLFPIISVFFKRFSVYTRIRKPVVDFI